MHKNAALIPYIYLSWWRNTLHLGAVIVLPCARVSAAAAPLSEALLEFGRRTRVLALLSRKYTECSLLLQQRQFC
jgi:hypothetical protein